MFTVKYIRSIFFCMFISLYAITHTTAVRNGLADFAVDAIDAGTTDTEGDLVFMTSGDVEVATINLANPAFGAAAAGTATLLGVPVEDSSATGGTIALFKMQDRDNTEVWRGTVTGISGGGDIEITSTVVVATEAVSLTSLTYSGPA